MAINRWMNKDVALIDKGILAIKKNEIMPSEAKWMDQEIVILSKVCPRWISYDIAYMWNPKLVIQMNLFTKQK